MRCGQVILSVDGKMLDGKSHEEIAKTILSSYNETTRSTIEFLVVQAKTAS